MNINLKGLRFGAAFLAIAGAFAVAMPSAEATLLTLTGPIAGNTVGPQSASNPCIIAGTTCQQPAGFGYNNFSPNNATSLNRYSNNPGTGNVPDGVQGSPYTVAQIEGVLNTNRFDVAIDVNTAMHQETLELFEVIVNGVVFDNYIGPTLIGNINNNGNGFGDWTLGVIDLSSFAPNATVLFHAVWDNASDGAESFFLVGQPPAVPEPASLAMIGSGLLGMAALRRLRRRRKDV